MAAAGLLSLIIQYFNYPLKEIDQAKINRDVVIMYFVANLAMVEYLVNSSKLVICVGLINV